MVVVVVVFESNVSVVVVVLVASESFAVAVVDKTKVVVKLENSVELVVGPVVFEKNRPVVVELILLEFSVVVGNVVDAVVVVVVVVVVELSWELAVLLQTRIRQDTAKIIPQPCSISHAGLLHSSMSESRAEERPDNF